MAAGDVSLLDSIVRIYKNSSGSVIGIQCINIREERPAVPGTTDVIPDLAERRKRGVRLSDTFTSYNLAMGGDRAIAIVQMIGKYDDFVTNGSNNDISQITYYGTDEYNDIVISLTEYPTVGDTV